MERRASRRLPAFDGPVLSHSVGSPYRNCGRCAGFSNIELPPLRGLCSQARLPVNEGSQAMYRATTRDIEVQVTPRFLSDRSSPENGYYFWAYPIEITNRGPATVQLKTRHWKITDAHGKLQEVRGAGVVGE